MLNSENTFGHFQVPFGKKKKVIRDWESKYQNSLSRLKTHNLDKNMTKSPRMTLAEVVIWTFQSSFYIHINFIFYCCSYRLYIPVSLPSLLGIVLVGLWNSSFLWNTLPLTIHLFNSNMCFPFLFNRLLNSPSLQDIFKKFNPDP